VAKMTDKKRPGPLRAGPVEVSREAVEASKGDLQGKHQGEANGRRRGEARISRWRVRAAGVPWKKLRRSVAAAGRLHQYKRSPAMMGGVRPAMLMGSLGAATQLWDRTLQSASTALSRHSQSARRRQPNQLPRANIQPADRYLWARQQSHRHAMQCHCP